MKLKEFLYFHQIKLLELSKVSGVDYDRLFEIVEVGDRPTINERNSILTGIVKFKVDHSNLMLK